MIGLEERDTLSGIHVVRLHDSADPYKRTAEWREEAHRGLNERDWQREHEINWTVASGLPVYDQEFSRELHIAKQPLVYDKLCGPVYRGWDFGGTPACVWGQCDSFGRLLFLAELVTWNGRGAQKQSNIEAFMPLAIQQHNSLFGAEAQCIDYADPSGWSRSQTDGKSCIEVMAMFKVYCQPGPVSWKERNHAMTRALTRVVGGSAALVVSPTCRMLVEGFGGAYRYKQIGQSELHTEDPEKNAWSHPMDGAHYVVGGLFRPTKQYSEDPEPEPYIEPDPLRAGQLY